MSFHVHTILPHFDSHGREMKGEEGRGGRFYFSSFLMLSSVEEREGGRGGKPCGAFRLDCNSFCWAYGMRGRGRKGREERGGPRVHAFHHPHEWNRRTITEGKQIVYAFRAFPCGKRTMERRRRGGGKARSQPLFYHAPWTAGARIEGGNTESLSFFFPANFGAGKGRRGERRRYSTTESIPFLFNGAPPCQ